MSWNAFGEALRITTFGESHGPAVGVVVDGVMPGLEVDLAEIQRELDRRRPGRSVHSSPRKEADRVHVLSGLFEGRTTGSPICLVVYNEGADPSAYDRIRDLFRPGHADLTFLRKYGVRDHRGGGRSSGRETLARVAAGALAKKLLATRGVSVLGFVREVAGVPIAAFDEEALAASELRCPDPAAEPEMAAAIAAAKASGDSVGGVVEVRARGVPAGLGDPVFFKLDARLAAALMGIGAVKGVEVGDGFGLARLRGSEANDPITPQGFASNRHGGVLGGISSGAEIVVRVAVKPTPSIAQPQQTVDVHGRPAEIRVGGRHDPCICPRLVPVAEAMVALVLADAMLIQRAIEGAEVDRADLQSCVVRLEGAMLEAAAQREALCRRLVEIGGLGGEAGAARGRARDEVAAAVGLRPELADQLFALLDRGLEEG